CTEQRSMIKKSLRLLGDNAQRFDRQVLQETAFGQPGQSAKPAEDFEGQAKVQQRLKQAAREGFILDERIQAMVHSEQFLSLIVTVGLQPQTRKLTLFVAALLQPAGVGEEASVVLGAVQASANQRLLLGRALGKRPADRCWIHLDAAAVVVEALRLGSFFRV